MVFFFFLILLETLFLPILVLVNFIVLILPIIDPIAYFWTNVNPNPPIMQGSSYDGANYAIRNLTGGVGAVNSTIVPTNEIVVGQRFYHQKQT